MAKSLIVHIQVKETAATAGIQNVSADFYTELESKVKKLIEESCARAKKNSRTTVMGKDA